MVNKMTASFQSFEGGLFGTVAKADVGDTAARLQEQGVALMCWADPFYPAPSIPQHVLRATVDALESGFSSHYTTPIGNPTLKDAIAKKLAKCNGLKVDAQRNILITPGSDSGLFYAMLPFINPGDEVMMIDPSYPNNFQNTLILGGSIVRVPVHAENGYQFCIEDFESRVTPQTKMVVLTNPNNPTTVVYRREQLEALARFIVKHDLVLVVDQAFEEPIFDGIEMVSMAALPGMWERTLSVFSLSKGMGLSGYRVGYIVTDDRIMDKLYGAMVTVLGATNTAAQLGAIAALTDDSFLEQYYHLHLERRNMVWELLGDIPGVVMQKPESGFLSWLDVSALGQESEIADLLLRQAKVSINLGTPYGEQGKGHLRIVHGVFGNSEDLRTVLLRMRQALLERAAEKGLIKPPNT